MKRQVSLNDFLFFSHLMYQIRDANQRAAIPIMKDAASSLIWDSDQTGIEQMAPVFIFSQSADRRHTFAWPFISFFDRVLREPSTKKEIGFQAYSSHQRTGYLWQEFKKIEILNSKCNYQALRRSAKSWLQPRPYSFILGFRRKSNRSTEGDRRYRIRSQKSTRSGRWFPDIHSQGWKTHLQLKSSKTNPWQPFKLTDKSMRYLRRTNRH